MCAVGFDRDKYTVMGICAVCFEFRSQTSTQELLASDMQVVDDAKEENEEVLQFL